MCSHVYTFNVFVRILCVGDCITYMHTYVHMYINAYDVV